MVIRQLLCTVITCYVTVLKVRAIMVISLQEVSLWDMSACLPLAFLGTLQDHMATIFHVEYIVCFSLFSFLSINLPLH